MNQNTFTYTGTVHRIGQLQTFNSGFKKREIVLTATNGEYVDYAVFEAKKDLADRVGLLRPGAPVRVTFVLNAREWDGPKGKRWFGSATALKVEAADAAGSEPQPPPPQPQPEAEQPDVVADDLPF